MTNISDAFDDCKNLKKILFEGNISKIKDFLLENGYIYVRENKWDDIYIHSSLKGNFSDLFIDDENPV